MKHVALLQRLSADDRADLARASEWNAKVLELFHATRFAEAVPIAQQAVEVRGKILGQKHPNYATSLRLESALSAASHTFRESLREVTLESLYKVLSEDVALIDFLEFQHDTPLADASGQVESTRNLAAFVIRRDEPVVMKDLGSVAVLSETIDTWRGEQERDFGRSSEAAHAGQLLRERFWEPLEPHVGGARLVLVSPDGVLGRLPLPALPGRKPGTYLLEDYAIALLPAARDLPLLFQDQPSRQVEGNMLLVGDVDYDRQATLVTQTPIREFGRREAPGAEEQNWAHLLGTEGEIATILRRYQRLFGSEGITMCSGRKTRHWASVCCRGAAMWCTCRQRTA